MYRRLGVLVLAALAVAGCGSSGHRAARSAPTAQRPTLPTKAAPDSVGTFPCPPHPGTTVDIEACSERRRLALDRRFDALVADLWPTLDGAGRRGFARSQAAWRRYVRIDCATQARAYLGGSAAGVVVADCQEQRTAQRVREVQGILALYCQGRVRTRRYRHCPRGGE